MAAEVPKSTAFSECTRKPDTIVARVGGRKLQWLNNHA